MTRLDSFRKRWEAALGNTAEVVAVFNDLLAYAEELELHSDFVVRVAYEPIGPAEASDRDVLTYLTEEARGLLSSIPVLANRQEAVRLSKSRRKA